MPITSPDARIAFKQTAFLHGPTAILAVDVFGGPIIQLFVAIFDAADKLIDGIGGTNQAPPPSSKLNGTASWLFAPPTNASYMKWGIHAIRSGGGLGQYSITSKVHDADGAVLAIGRFSAKIDDDQLDDKIIFDGVNLSLIVKQLDVPNGAAV